MITVFYDGACGLCSKEINYYRRIAPAEVFDWHDIMRSSVLLQQEGISLSEGLMQLHAKDEAGVIHKGVDAFILMWQHLGAWRWLACLVFLPLIKQSAQILYREFCKRRFARSAHCKVAALNEQ